MHSQKLGGWLSRVLKLLSGMLMILLGGVLLIEPALLNNPLWASGLLGSAVLVTGIVAASMRKGWSRRG